MSVPRRIERFARRVPRYVADEELAGALLDIADAVRPPAAVEATLDTLDAWAAACSPRSFASLREVLFDEVGLAGDTDDYGDPENSMLDTVVAARRGIPITLSIVMIETGRRAGVVVEPIGMPGHFLVRDRASGIYCDPFAGGVLLDERGCEARFRSLFGANARFGTELLERTSAPFVIARTLANLEASRWANDPHRLRTMLELHRCIPGLPPTEHLRIAERLENIGAFDAAAAEATSAAAALPDDQASGARARAIAARARTN